MSITRFSFFFWIRSPCFPGWHEYSGLKGSQCHSHQDSWECEHRAPHCLLLDTEYCHGTVLLLHPPLPDHKTWLISSYMPPYTCIRRYNMYNVSYVCIYVNINTHLTNIYRLPNFFNKPCSSFLSSFPRIQVYFELNMRM